VAILHLHFLLQVNYTPQCGHSMSVDCNLKQMYLDSTCHFVCGFKELKKLPRCGHNAELTCEGSLQIETWSFGGDTPESQSSMGILIKKNL